MSKKRAGATAKQGRSPAGSKGAFCAPRAVGRRNVLLALGAVTVAGGGAALWLGTTPAEAGEVVVYKDPYCECCGRWAAHMRRNGFSVTVHNVDDMDPVKRRAGIPEALDSCHTAEIGGYVVEGHVPAADIKRMLAERPVIRGLAVPGMPSSAPGMDSPAAEPYVVYAFDDRGGTGIFAKH